MSRDESDFARMIRDQDAEMLKTGTSTIRDCNNDRSQIPQRICNPISVWDNIHRAAQPDISPEKLSHMINPVMVANELNRQRTRSLQPNHFSAAFVVSEIDRMEQVEQVNRAFRRTKTISSPAVPEVGHLTSLIG